MKKPMLLLARLYILLLLVGCAAGAAERLPSPTETPVLHPQVEIGTTAVSVIPVSVPVWKTQLSGAVNVPPVVEGDRVIVATAAGQIHGVSTATGALVWSFAPETRLWDASLRVAEGLACAGQEGGLLTCLDSETGEERWTAVPGIEIQSRPALADGHLYAPSTWVGTGITNDFEGKAVLFALDAGSGEIIWQAETENYILRRPIVSEDLVIVGGAFFELRNGKETALTRIYAFDAENGSVRWQYESEDGLIRWVAASTEAIAFAGKSEIVRGLDPENGRLLWSFGPSYWMQFPAAANGTFFMGTGDERFHALNAATGSPLWETSIDLDSLNQIGRPNLKENLIIFNAVTGDIYALRQDDGQQVKHLETGLTARVGGILYDNLYIMGDPEGGLYAFSLDQ